MADDSIQYGPAQSRRSKTPISFSSDEPEAGRFIPPSDLEEFLSKIPLISKLVNGGGSIQINPANTSDVDRVVRHESVHALLNPLVESGQLANLNSQNPAFAQMASKISAAQAGNPSVEAPAYASTGESQAIGIPVPASDAYINTLKQQLFKLDPKLAGRLGGSPR